MTAPLYFLVMIMTVPQGVAIAALSAPMTLEQCKVAGGAYASGAPTNIFDRPSWVCVPSPDSQGGASK